MEIFEMSVKYISVFDFCKSFYLFIFVMFYKKCYSILLKRLIRMFDIPHCDVIYYAFYVIADITFEKP